MSGIPEIPQLCTSDEGFDRVCRPTGSDVGELHSPRQRVIVFMECPVSGATLGYCGTIIRVQTRSICRHASEPGLWTYRVFVPFFQACMDVAARNLFPSGGLDLAKLPVEEDADNQGSEFHIACDPETDLDEIHGAYRIGVVWYHFTFRKCDQPQPTFELRLAAESGMSVAGSVHFQVPRDTRLNASFVLREIARVLGATETKSQSRIMSSNGRSHHEGVCTMKTTPEERTFLCHYIRELFGGGFEGPAHELFKTNGVKPWEIEPLATIFVNEARADPELYPAWIENHEITPTEPWVPPAENVAAFRARIAEAKSELQKLGPGTLANS
ncbi:MAG: hypothetical protein ACUVQH_12345 [Thermogutta sp.]